MSLGYRPARDAQKKREKYSTEYIKEREMQYTSFLNFLKTKYGNHYYVVSLVKRFRQDQGRGAGEDQGRRAGEDQGRGAGEDQGRRSRQVC